MKGNKTNMSRTNHFTQLIRAKKKKGFLLAFNNLNKLLEKRVSLGVPISN